jgi:hypothetical protein
MTATTAPSRRPSVQRLIESRPPSLSWSRPSPMQSNQPSLDLIDHDPECARPAPANDQGVRVAMIQALLGQRPVAQAIR